MFNISRLDCNNLIYNINYKYLVKEYSNEKYKTEIKKILFQIINCFNQDLINSLNKLVKVNESNKPFTERTHYFIQNTVINECLSVENILFFYKEVLPEIEELYNEI